MRANKIKQQLAAWAEREFPDADKILVKPCPLFGRGGLWDVTVEFPEDGIIEIHSFKAEGEQLRFLGVMEIEEA